MSERKFRYVDVMPELVPADSVCAICRERAADSDGIVAAIETARPLDADPLFFHRDCL